MGGPVAVDPWPVRTAPDPVALDGPGYGRLLGAPAASQPRGQPGARIRHARTRREPLDAGGCSRSRAPQAGPGALPAVPRHRRLQVARSGRLGHAPGTALACLAAADQTIDLVVRAQSPDGYLKLVDQVAFPELRWTDVAYSHEIYAAGHLMQAAVAWSRALDDRRLLEVAIRFADHVDSVFGPGRRSEPDGHPLVESALNRALSRDGRASLPGTGPLLPRRAWSRPAR